MDSQNISRATNGPCVYQSVVEEKWISMLCILLALLKTDVLEFLKIALKFTLHLGLESLSFWASLSLYIAGKTYLTQRPKQGARMPQSKVGNKGGVFPVQFLHAGTRIASQEHWRACWHQSLSSIHNIRGAGFLGAFKNLLHLLRGTYKCSRQMRASLPLSLHRNLDGEKLNLPWMQAIVKWLLYALLLHLLENEESKGKFASISAKMHFLLLKKETFLSHFYPTISLTL